MQAHRASLREPGCVRDGKGGRRGISDCCVLYAFSDADRPPTRCKLRRLTRGQDLRHYPDGAGAGCASARSTRPGCRRPTCLAEPTTHATRSRQCNPKLLPCTGLSGTLRADLPTRRLVPCRSVEFCWRIRTADPRGGSPVHVPGHRQKAWRCGFGCRLARLPTYRGRHNHPQAPGRSVASFGRVRRAARPHNRWAASVIAERGWHIWRRRVAIPCCCRRGSR